MSDEKKNEVGGGGSKADVLLGGASPATESVVDRFNAFGMAVATAVLISGVISVGIAGFCFYKVSGQSPVSVDIQKIIVDEISVTSKMVLDPKRGQERGAKFSGALEMALDDVSEGGRRLVLVGPASLRGARDVTPEVMAAVKKSLGGN